MSTLFRRFRCEYAVMHEPCILEKNLAASGKPYLLVDLGLPIRERGWKLNGWTLQGEDAGETWRASFDEPGIVAREDFADRSYRWLVVHLTEGPAGGRKTIAVNGQVLGQFIRTGPPVSVKKEWWVTRSFPIPAGLLKNGPLEIRFTDPGIAVRRRRSGCGTPGGTRDDWAHSNPMESNRPCGRLVPADSGLYRLPRPWYRDDVLSVRMSS